MNIDPLHQYAADVFNAQYDQMEVDASDFPTFEARLDQTVKELQERVEKQQRALDKLRASSSNPVPQAPSLDPRVRLQQLRLLRDAYGRLAPPEPSFPGPASVLPALLATQFTQQSIADAKDALKAAREKLTATERKLDSEGGSVQDANLVTTSLESRIKHLRTQNKEKANKSPIQVAKDLVNAVRKQKQTYEADSKRLQEALETFVEDHLAALLAAEELGGPVVGNLVEVDDSMLEAGFSHQGKPKALKHGQGPPSSKRQRRIDEIWGERSGADERPLDEKRIVGDEIRKLVGELYDALVDEGSGGAHIELERDSAAARFLVRAKVAQFHPRDARRMRLIDFGRDLDE